MKRLQHHAAHLVMCAAVMLVGMAGHAAMAAALTLTGEQEVPPVITSGNGSGELVVAADGTISGSITTHGVAGTMAHIHLGAMGTNGPVIISLIRGDGGVWTVPPLSRLTVDQLKAYRSGGLYINVHTDANKGGEVRAQITP